MEKTNRELVENCAQEPVIHIDRPITVEEFNKNFEQAVKLIASLFQEDQRKSDQTHNDSGYQE